MRVHVPRIAIPCTALGLTLAAAVPAAHAQTMYDAAQTVIAPQPVVVVPAATAIVRPAGAANGAHRHHHDDDPPGTAPAGAPPRGGHPA